MAVERYRGHIIERHHSGPWDVTYEWAREGWDLGDPIGYEPSIAKCKEAIDDLIADRCTPCGGTGEMKVDPFEADLMPCPHCPPMIHLDMPGSEYAALDALSAAFLRDMLATTPLQAKKLKEAGRPDSEAKAFGRALHCCVLEPERFERDVAVMPEFKGEGSRSLRAEWIIRNAGKIQVKPKVLEQLLGMRDAVMKHPEALDIFNICTGRNEVSAVWDDPLGIRCKVRWDRLYAEGSLMCQVDLKSTRSAQEDFFRYDMKQYGYDVEACFFTRALEVLHGPMPRPFDFIAVEKMPPYRVEVYGLTRSERTLGTQKMLRAMAVYAHCRQTNEWPDTPVFRVEESE